MDKLNKIRILIAENHEIVRSGLKATIDEQGDFQVIGDTISCEKALSCTPLLCKAIRSVHMDNELWVSKQLVMEIWKCNTAPPDSLIAQATQVNGNGRQSNVESMGLVNTLTQREKQIACLSSKGLTAKKIGAELLISKKRSVISRP